MSNHKIKVVFNDCHGGFGLSDKAMEMYSALSGKSCNFDVYGIPRHDLNLVLVVETLREESWGRFSELQIRDLKGRQYRIDEYDGWETVMEPDDYEWIVV